MMLATVVTLYLREPPLPSTNSSFKIVFPAYLVKHYMPKHLVLITLKQIYGWILIRQYQKILKRLLNDGETTLNISIIDVLINYDNLIEFFFPKNPYKFEKK